MYQYLVDSYTTLPNSNILDIHEYGISEVNRIYKHGTLNIEAYACFKRPPEEVPEDFALIRIFDFTFF